MFLYAWIALAVATFFYLLYRDTAPYGRHSSTEWGAMLPHRLGWFLMELPALLLVPVLFGMSDLPWWSYNALFVALWTLHYINRTLIFSIRQRTSGKQMPFAIVLSAIGFNVVNGYLCGHFFATHSYPTDWASDIRFGLGLCMFVGGAWLNIWADNQLLALRQPHEKGYKIPYGGMFRYVSCPNLLGELVEWAGFALMAWSLPAFAFAAWSAANLLPRALAHHRWYRAHFADYPPDRKAVVPFWW